MQSDINVTYLHNCCEYLKIYSSFLWKHYFVQDTYQITYGKKLTSESIYLKIHTDIINEPPLKTFRNRAHRNERRVQRAYKSRLRSKNTQTNLKRSASKRFGGVFFFTVLFPTENTHLLGARWKGKLIRSMVRYEYMYIQASGVRIVDTPSSQ